MGEMLERVPHLIGQREVIREQLARIPLEPLALAAPAGQDVDDVAMGVGEAGEIVGAQLPPVIFVEALLRHVGADQRRELGLLEAQPLAFFRQSCAEAHAISAPPPRVPIQYNRLLYRSCREMRTGIATKLRSRSDPGGAAVE